MDKANVEVITEEILVHNTCTKDHGKIWTGTANIIGSVIINGKQYHFDRTVDIEFEETKTFKSLEA